MYGNAECRCGVGGNLSAEQTSVARHAVTAGGRHVTTISTHPRCRVMYVARVSSVRTSTKTYWRRDDVVMRTHVTHAISRVTVQTAVAVDWREHAIAWPDTEVRTIKTIDKTQSLNFARSWTDNQQSVNQSINQSRF